MIFEQIRKYNFWIVLLYRTKIKFVKYKVKVASSKIIKQKD